MIAQIRAWISELWEDLYRGAMDFWNALASLGVR